MCSALWSTQLMSSLKANFLLPIANLKSARMFRPTRLYSPTATKSQSAEVLTEWILCRKTAQLTCVWLTIKQDQRSLSSRMFFTESIFRCYCIFIQLRCRAVTDTGILFLPGFCICLQPFRIFRQTVWNQLTSFLTSLIKSSRWTDFCSRTQK